MNISLRPFKELFLGDTVSILQNSVSVPHRIMRIVHQDELYRSQMKDGHIFLKSSYIECYPSHQLRYFLEGENVEGRNLGLVKQVCLTDKYTILSGEITFRKEYIKQVKKGLYVHTDSVQIGDIIWNQHDANHYYLEKLHNVSSMDYGGMSYDVSHFCARKVDENKVPSKDTITVPVGDFAMSRHLYYPVIVKSKD
jgi:hypothetical protein